MLFGGPEKKRKKFDTLWTEATALLQESKGEAFPPELLDRAKKLWELAVELLPEPAPLQRIVDLRSHLASAKSDWQGVQAVHEQASAEADKALGPGSTAAIEVAVNLARVLRLRGQFDRALFQVDQRLKLAPPRSPVRLQLQLERIPALCDLERHDEAVAAARAAFDAACNDFGENSAAAAVAARALASALISADGDLDLAAALAQKGFLPEVRRPEEVPHFLNGALVLSRVFLKRGQFEEAASVADRGQTQARRVRSVHAPPLPVEIELWAAHAEALGALGQKEKAIEAYRSAIRMIETGRDARAPELIPHLEGLADLLRPDAPRDADVLEKRAVAARTLLTGKRPAPRKPKRTQPAVTAMWPRRTLSGIFTLAGVDADLLARLLGTTLRSAGMNVNLQVYMPKGAHHGTAILEGWEDPWHPNHALRNRVLLRALTETVELAKAARNDAPGSLPIELITWWTVQDEIAARWSEWPAELWDRWKTELFPSLPGWLGQQGRFTWLGTGLRREPEGAISAEPTVALDFRDQAITVKAIAPGPMLDEWFTAFLRATKLVPVEGYSPIVPVRPIAAA